MTWRRLKVVIERLPESSALFRARNPDAWRWGVAEQLLATAVDALNIANWMRSRDGHRGVNRPTPIERPGVRAKNTRRLGTTAMSRAEVDAWLAAGDGVSIVTAGAERIE